MKPTNRTCSSQTLEDIFGTMASMEKYSMSTLACSSICDKGLSVNKSFDRQSVCVGKHSYYTLVKIIHL